MEVHGYPLKTPMLDIHTVGAGGGSIAYIDAGGLLKVGPRSAGADAGPGLLRPRQRRSRPSPTPTSCCRRSTRRICSAGAWRSTRRAAEAAIAELAERLGLDVMATAQGIISVVTANMAKAIRVISVQRGYDPRDYTLVAFGGAGPLHAARLARELDIPRVLVPRNPGHPVRARPAADRPADQLLADAAAAARRWQALAGDARDAFAELERARRRTGSTREGIAPAGRGARAARSTCATPARTTSCPSPCPDEPRRRGAARRAARRASSSAHEQMYGYSAPEEPIQVVTFRLEATARCRKAELPRRSRPATAPLDARSSAPRDVWLAGGAAASSLARSTTATQLGPGHRIAGPAIVEQMDATTLLLPGQTPTVDAYLNLIVEG